MDASGDVLMYGARCEWARDAVCLGAGYGIRAPVGGGEMDIDCVLGRDE